MKSAFISTVSFLSVFVVDTADISQHINVYIYIDDSHLGRLLQIKSILIFDPSEQKQ